MKKLFFLLCACFLCTMVSNAQSREALEDSVIVGGISHSMIEMVLGADQMKADEKHCSGCEHSNFCIGRMYSKSMQCHKRCEDITPGLVKAVEKINAQNDRMERKLGYK